MSIRPVGDVCLLAHCLLLYRKYSGIRRVVFRFRTRGAQPSHPQRLGLDKVLRQCYDVGPRRRRKQAVLEFVAIGVKPLEHCLRFMSRLADGIDIL